MPLMNEIKLIQTFVALIILNWKIFNINDPFAIKLLTKLRLGFSHQIREPKFRHGFKNTLNPLY